MLAVAQLLNLYSYVVLASVILSWIRLPEDNPIVKAVAFLTEPVLGPIRRLMPQTGGLDFSAMIVLILLRVVREALLRRAGY